MAAPDSPASPSSAPGGARRLVWIIVAGLVALAVVVVLLLRPWESGTPGADPGDRPGTVTTSPTPTPTDVATDEPQEPLPPQPVPIESPGTITDGLTAAITGIEAVDGVAEGPGEVAGPAIRFTVSIVNTGSSPVDLSATVVTVDHGSDRVPGGQLNEPGGRPIPTTVAAGETATGVFIFTVPLDRRGLVNITVDHTVGVVPLVFSGPTP